MRDQAENLRLRLQSQQNNNKKARAIAVVSGKGGVGKSNFSLNFSISLLNLDKKVLLIDMDIGMGNLDILMGKAPRYTIVDYLKNQVPLQEIVMEGHGIQYIAGGSGLTQLVKIDENLLQRFTNELHYLFEQYDYIIFDMGAGISDESLRILLSVHEIIIVTTPEPTAITDAYSTMKYIHVHDSTIPMYMVVNKIQTEKEGKETFDRLFEVLNRFLGKQITLLGYLPEDRSINQAVKRQIPFLIFNAKSPAAVAIKSLTNRYQSQNFYDKLPPTLPFVSKLKKFLFER